MSRHLPAGTAGLRILGARVGDLMVVAELEPGGDRIRAVVTQAGAAAPLARPTEPVNLADPLSADAALDAFVDRLVARYGPPVAARPAS